MNERDPFGESMLRRALRLEGDERAPRVNVARLAATAAATGPAWDEAVLAATLAVCLALAGVAAMAIAGVVWAAWIAAPALAAEIFENVLAAVAVPLAESIRFVSVFVSPVSLFATIAAAILYVRLTERGTNDVPAP